MIVGLGIDVCSVARIETALERFGEKFWARVLTPRERVDLAARKADRAAALAGRFAAKEAFSKALGAPKDVWWQDVEVRRSPNGAPELVAHGPALPYLSELGVTRTLISITHDAGVAAAVVVLER
ncbi:MAG: holo-ACP synthase [Polyangiaceae bacterium]|nr:holo-ACP synthase [Myxococcales bacterium]MCC6901721.1 holo-ACP synthase [Polyangiaceae bacterium]